MKLCPLCAEEIQDAAIKCKHCGGTIGGESVKTEAPAEPQKDFAEPVSAGVKEPKYKHYHQVPIYRKQWFFWMLYLLAIVPAFIIIANAFLAANNSSVVSLPTIFIWLGECVMLAALGILIFGDVYFPTSSGKVKSFGIPNKIVAVGFGCWALYSMATTMFITSGIQMPSDCFIKTYGDLRVTKDGEVYKVYMGKSHYLVEPFYDVKPAVAACYKLKTEYADLISNLNQCRQQELAADKKLPSMEMDLDALRIKLSEKKKVGEQLLQDYLKNIKPLQIKNQELPEKLLLQINALHEVYEEQASQAQFAFLEERNKVTKGPNADAEYKKLDKKLAEKRSSIINSMNNTYEELKNKYETAKRIAEKNAEFYEGKEAAVTLNAEETESVIQEIRSVTYQIEQRKKDGNPFTNRIKELLAALTKFD